MNDSFLILGLKKDADKPAIRRAYRDLAKLWHPDQPDGDAAKFMQIRRAYEHLSQEGLDSTFTARPKRRQFFPWRVKKTRPVLRKPPITGADTHIRLHIHLDDLVKGAMRQLTLPNGKTIEVRIQKGLSANTKLKLKAMGNPGFNGGNPGNLFIELKVKPQENFLLVGRDIHMELSLPLACLREGGVERIRTPSGLLTLNIPHLSSPGTMLKIAKKGLPANGQAPAGDLLIQLTALPTNALTASVDQFARSFLPPASRLRRHLSLRTGSGLTKQ